MKKIYIEIKGHNFELVKAKNFEGVIRRYNMSDISNIYQAYKNPSYDKIYAYDYLKELSKDMNGYRFYIIGYNCSMFSVGWCVEIDNKEYFIYVTKDNNRIMEI